MLAGKNIRETSGAAGVAALSWSSAIGESESRE
jgi:hypothetical protein